MNLKQNIFFISLALLLCCMAQTQALGEQTIILTDGSVIKGQVVGASENNFVIKTQTMGTVSVEQSRVREISREEPGISVPQQFSKTAASSSVMGSSQQFGQMQSALMSNPKIMQAVQDLLSDPEVVKLLEDPELAGAIQNGADPMSLMSNPAFMKIMNHPKIQAAVQSAVTDMMSSGTLNQ